MNNHSLSNLEQMPIKTVSVEQKLESVIVPSIKTLVMQEAANDAVINVNFRELTKLAEKMKWEERFIKAYSDGVRPLTLAIYNPKYVTYIVASSKGKDLGHIRLVKKSMMLENGEVTIRSLDTAFIKKPYRRDGVFKKLIAHAVDGYATKLIRLEAYRFYNHQYYYECLGFTRFLRVDETAVGYAVHESIQEMIPCMKPLAA